VTDDAPEERKRVFAKIAATILEFHDIHPGAEFHVEELRRFVLGRVQGIAPDSPGRILRELRLRGVLDYIIVNRRQSLYRFCTNNLL
jgi:hypothetical protein